MLLCHTMYCVTQCIVSHNVLCHTMYCAAQCIVSHNVLCRTMYCATQCIVPHNVLCRTMYCATQYPFIESGKFHENIKGLLLIMILSHGSRLLFIQLGIHVVNSY